MLRLIFPTLNEWHQINYRNSSLLRYVALALVGFRRSLGYIGVPKFCEEGIADVELFRPVA